MEKAVGNLLKISRTHFADGHTKAAGPETQAIVAAIPCHEDFMKHACDTEPQLLDIPNPFIAECGRIRLLEPMDACVKDIHERLLDGTYRKAFIVDDGRLRYLHFGLNYVQSVMRIDQPERLDLRYTQKMMGFLLFMPEPARVLMLGLGGGSLAKYCYRRLPEARISVIEIDPDVIALRRHFSVPDDDARFRVIRGDGFSYLGESRETVDVLLVDAFDADGLAQSVSGGAFLHAAHARLADDGILVMNLTGERSRYAALIDEAATIFEEQTLLVPVKNDGNFVLFAFKDRLFVPDWPQLRSRAKALRRALGLDFPAFVSKFEKMSRCRFGGEAYPLPRRQEHSRHGKAS